MKKCIQTILISGARAPISLEMARSFDAAGHRVVMIDSQHLTISRWSNAVYKYFTVPSPRFDNEGFIAKLLQIIEIEKVDHLIPTCEEAIYIAFHKSTLPCKVWTSEYNLMIQLHNKYLFTQLFTHLLPIPKTVRLKDFTDWQKSKSYVFKPTYSRFGTFVKLNAQLAIQDFSETDQTEWVVQQKICGKEVCVYTIWENGILKAYSAYHPLYRAGKGSGIFFEPVANSQLFHYVQNFGLTINYHGQLCFDVIIDDCNQLYFIECNPRGTSGAHLINKQLAATFLNEYLYINNHQDDYAIKYGMFLLYPLSFFTKKIYKSKDAIFCWSDIKPFLFQIASILEITYIKISKRLTWLEATTSDIEWNGN